MTDKSVLASEIKVLCYYQPDLEAVTKKTLNYIDKLECTLFFTAIILAIVEYQVIMDLISLPDTKC